MQWYQYIWEFLWIFMKNYGFFVMIIVWQLSCTQNISTLQCKIKQRKFNLKLFARFTYTFNATHFVFILPLISCAIKTNWFKFLGFFFRAKCEPSTQINVLKSHGALKPSSSHVLWQSKGRVVFWSATSSIWLWISICHHHVHWRSRNGLEPKKNWPPFVPCARTFWTWSKVRLYVCECVCANVNWMRNGNIELV